MCIRIVQLFTLSFFTFALTACGKSQEQIEVEYQTLKAQRALEKQLSSAQRTEGSSVEPKQEKARQEPRTMAEEKKSEDKKNVKTTSYKNLVACVHPYASGLASTLATNLMQFAASDNSYAFGAALNSKAYAQYCQLAYGTPGDENIGMASRVAETGNNVYWVADRGNAAVGFIEHK